MNYISFYKFSKPFMLFPPAIFISLYSFILIIVVLSIILYKYMNKKIYKILFINCLLIIFSLFFMFVRINTVLVFIFNVLLFIASIYLNDELCSNKKSANLLVPYILWCFYLALTSLIILFMNS